MALITKGPITFTPVTVTTKMSLPDLHEAILELGASPGVPSPGWGSIFDDADAVGLAGRSTVKPGQALMLEEDSVAPERIVARFYWRQVDRALLRALGDADPLRVQRLHAADVIISATHVPNEYLVLLGARRRDEINGYIVPGLTALGDESGVLCQVRSDVSPLDFGDDDFFRWLLYRRSNEPKVGDDLQIRDVRSVSAQDRSDRGTVIKQGADMDRPEMLALIMAPSVRLGPAKIFVTSDELELNLDVEIRVDGGFSIQVGESDYDDNYARADIGLPLVRDTAYYVIPELRSAYNSDQNWRDLNRSESIEEAQKKMLALLTRK